MVNLAGGAEIANMLVDFKFVKDSAEAFNEKREVAPSTIKYAID